MVKKIHTYEMLLAWQMVLCMPARKVVLVVYNYTRRKK